MAWIELHQTLPRHPKLARLAHRLRVPRAQAAGHLTFLWLWALDYCPKGDLSGLEPAEISAGADFGGDAELFCQALRQSGWVDADGKIHDWMEYAGKLIEAREKDKKRKADRREADKQNVSGGNPADGGRTADVQYSTVPNQTSEASPPQRAREGEVVTSGTIPTIDDVITHGQMQNIPHDFCERFWLHYDSSGWVDKNGNPIAKWDSKLRSLWRKEQADIAQGKRRETNGNRNHGGGAAGALSPAEKRNQFIIGADATRRQAELTAQREREMAERGDLPM